MDYRTITKGKRTLGWVVNTPNNGKVLVVRTTPRALGVKTKRKDFVSLNESAANDEAGFPLKPDLFRALQSHRVDKVAFYIPKTGFLYITEASNYLKCFTMVARNKHGDRDRCVMLEHFEKIKYHIKL